jgi:hypothetical protein
VVFVAYDSNTEAGVHKISAGTQSPVFESNSADPQTATSDPTPAKTENATNDRESERRAPIKKRSIDRFRVLPAETAALQSSSRTASSSGATLTRVAGSNGGVHLSGYARQPLSKEQSFVETEALNFALDIDDHESFVQSTAPHTSARRDARRQPGLPRPKINMALEETLVAGSLGADEGVVSTVGLSLSVDRENRRRPIEAVEQDALFDELSERLEQAASEMGIE